MIKNKSDLEFYLSEDRRQLYRTRKWPKFLRDDHWRFQILLRYSEYYKNMEKKTIINKIKYNIIYFFFRRKGVKLGFSIPLNVFGPGLSIAHTGTIVVSGDCKVGKNCRLHVCVNIGTSTGAKEDVPKIGDNVFIGPGVKMFGDIIIADNIAIGANAVVNKSFLEKNISIAGIPAKKISNEGTKSMGIV